MKKILIYAVVLQFLFVFALFTVPLFLDKEYHVRETVEIQASPDKVRARLMDFKQWREWHAYSRKVNVFNRLRLSKKTAGPGAKLEWDSPGGYDGVLTIKKYTNSGLHYTSTFEKESFRARGSITWRREGKLTVVEWTESGTPRLYVTRIANFLFAARISKDLVAGLDALKDVCER